MRITRDIIRQDITYEGHTYEELCSHINRWKTLFITRGAKKGDLVALAILEMNLNHISAIFAIAELGMKLLVIDKPVTYETLHMTKMGLFGPVDFALECSIAAGYAWHHEMVQRYSKQIISEDEFIKWSDDSETFIACHPDDKFLLASTSGTTNTSKPVWFTHDQIVQISKRNIAVFKFEENSNVLHTRNMHHASSLLTFLFPAFMGSKNHYFAEMFTAESLNTFVTICQDHIIPKKIDRMLCGNMFDVGKLTESLKSVDAIPKKLLLNISGFTVTQSLVDMVNAYDVEFMSHYGSIDTGIPLLLNHIQRGHVFETASLGIQPDDFYRMETVDGYTHIYCKLWDGHRIIQDSLINNNGKWYYGGRLDRDPIDSYVATQTKEYSFVVVDGKRHLVLWDPMMPKQLFEHLSLTAVHHLDKEKFTVDTKINMDQLREYIRCTFGK